MRGYAAVRQVQVMIPLRPVTLTTISFDERVQRVLKIVF